MTPIFIELTYNDDLLKFHLNINEIAFIETNTEGPGTHIYLTHSIRILKVFEDRHTIIPMIDQAIYNRIAAERDNS